MDAKWCRGCMTNKPVDQFNKDSRKRTGLCSRCKACDKKKYDAYATRLAQNPVAPPEEKVCPVCSRTLPAKEFNRDTSRPDGLQSQCRLCKRAAIRLKTYGITRAETLALLDKQDGVCAICREVFGEKGFHVDHCHTGGQVRGLLCFKCNVGLGAFKDDPNLLNAAIEYL